jgi:hypothetical protein
MRTASSFLTLLLAATCTVSAQTTDSSASSPPPYAASLDEVHDDLDLDAGEELDQFSLEPMTPAAPGEVDKVQFILRGGASYQFDTGLDTAGDFSVARGSVGLGVQAPLGDRLSLNIGASYSMAYYDFERVLRFGFLEPWSDINTIRIMAIANYELNDQWAIFGGPMATIAAEGGADWSDACTGGGMAGVGYRVGPNVVMRLGVAATSELEDDASISPVILVEWQIDDHWRLGAGGLDAGASDVYGLGVTYAFDERFSIGGRIGAVRNRFRVDDSTFALAPDGIGQDERGIANLALIFRPAQQVEISFIVGVAFGGEIRIENSDGDGLFDEDYDPAAFGGFRVLLRF